MIYFDKVFFFNNERSLPSFFLFLTEEVNSGYNKYHSQRTLQRARLWR